MEGEVSKNTDTEKMFALELKCVLQKFNVAEFDCAFVMLIGDHSVSHERRLRDKNPAQNEGVESCDLTIIQRQKI